MCKVNNIINVTSPPALLCFAFLSFADVRDSSSSPNFIFFLSCETFPFFLRSSPNFYFRTSSLAAADSPVSPRSSSSYSQNRSSSFPASPFFFFIFPKSWQQLLRSYSSASSSKQTKQILLLRRRSTKPQTPPPEIKLSPSLLPPGTRPSSRATRHNSFRLRVRGSSSALIPRLPR